MRNSGAGGLYLKLSWDSKEAKRLHDLMTINKLSPYAAIEIARQENLNINFSARSLYNYIHQYNYPITENRLPMKNKRKKAARAALHGSLATMLKGTTLRSVLLK